MGTFRVLAVCTGNICRSPMMERLLQGALDERAAGVFEVTSAGTWAVPGGAMHPHAARYLGGKSAARPFASRRLHPLLLSDVDLVLTATREHRAAVVQLEPALVTRTFTLKEFAALVRDAPPEPDPRAVVAVAAARRGLVAVDDYDVADPISATRAFFDEVGEQVAQLADAVAAALADQHGRDPATSAAT